MFVGGGEMNLVGTDHAIQNLRIAGLERLPFGPARIAGGHVLFARHEDPTLGADKLDAVGIVAGDRHRHAVGVAGIGLELPVNVP